MKLVLAYKNFAVNQGISHIGLGVSAVNVAKVLKSQGVSVEVWPITSAQELEVRITDSGSAKPTHVVVSAPWIATQDWSRLVRRFSEIEFVVNCHSNVGFLQADPRGTHLFLEYGKLQQGSTNFRISGNSVAFSDWIQTTYNYPCLTLPNLYWLTGNTKTDRLPFVFGQSVLRIGAFGATRPLKNLQTMAAAVLTIATETRTPVEFWISGGRAEGGLTVLKSIQEMYSGLPNATIKENNWQDWTSFRATVRHMHLCMQMSYTESFNMVTADAIAEGVPSVVSGAVDWVPEHWEAHFDDAVDIARVARTLLTDVNAARDGIRALSRHNDEGIERWMDYLGLRRRWVRPAQIWSEEPLV